MTDPMLQSIANIITRLRECIAYSRQVNNPDVCVTEPYIAARAMTDEEIYETDKAVVELFFAVRGQYPSPAEWQGLHQKLDDAHPSRSANPQYAQPVSASRNWTIGLKHYTGATALISKLLQERIHQTELEAAKVPSTTYKEIIMGDVFKGISNSSIVNRSTFFDAVSSLEARGEKDLMALLEEVAEQVEASGNKEAGEILEQLTEELARDTPRSSLMKRSWAALTELLPDVAKIAGAGSTISKIFG